MMDFSLPHRVIVTIDYSISLFKYPGITYSYCRGNRLDELQERHRPRPHRRRNVLSLLFIKLHSLFVLLLSIDYAAVSIRAT